MRSLDGGSDPVLVWVARFLRRSLQSASRVPPDWRMRSRRAPACAFGLDVAPRDQAWQWISVAARNSRRRSLLEPLSWPIQTKPIRIRRRPESRRIIIFRRIVTFARLTISIVHPKNISGKWASLLTFMSHCRVVALMAKYSNRLRSSHPALGLRDETEGGCRRTELATPILTSPAAAWYARVGGEFAGPLDVGRPA